MQIKNLGKECDLWFQVNLETSPPILIVSNPKTQKQEYIFGKLNKNHRFCFDLKKFIANARIEIDEQNNVLWYKNGKCHREDGPAVVHANGQKEWWIAGKLHREDGPALIELSGSKRWYQNGILHRENGPAIIHPCGTKYWFKYGMISRKK